MEIETFFSAFIWSRLLVVPSCSPFSAFVLPRRTPGGVRGPLMLPPFVVSFCCGPPSAIGHFVTSSVLSRFPIDTIAFLPSPRGRKCQPVQPQHTPSSPSCFRSIVTMPLLAKLLASLNQTSIQDNFLMSRRIILRTRRRLEGFAEEAVVSREQNRAAFSLRQISSARDFTRHAHEAADEQN